jgi:glycosyltransferase involved in cell wall biosynthesis
MTGATAIAPAETKTTPNRCEMLSILLPVRNEGINLRIMLKILRAVVDLPHEVLVVYDSAADESIPVIDDVRKNYPELRGVQNTLGNGVVNAIRCGVASSQGDVILIFAADRIDSGRVRFRQLHTLRAWRPATWWFGNRRISFLLGELVVPSSGRLAFHRRNDWNQNVS